MENAINKIRVFVEDSLKDREDLFLIDLIVKGNTGTVKVLVILDGDQGILIEDCIQVSRQLSGFLEEDDPIEGKYTLEVTSAGLEHPLKVARQYAKNIGRGVKVVKNDLDVIEGKLTAVNDKDIALEVLKDKKKKIVDKIIVPFSDIQKTNVLVSFK